MIDALVLAELQSLRQAVDQMRNMTRPLLMSQARVAAELSMSTRTVKRMLGRGELTAVRSKNCRRTLISAQEVERWIREHTVQPDTRQKKRNPKSEAEKIRALTRL